jgi:hypothetical protein
MYSSAACLPTLASGSLSLFLHLMIATTCLCEPRVLWSARPTMHLPSRIRHAAKRPSSVWLELLHLHQSFIRGRNHFGFFLDQHVIIITCSTVYLLFSVMFCSFLFSYSAQHSYAPYSHFSGVCYHVSLHIFWMAACPFSAHLPSIGLLRTLIPVHSP